MSATDELRRMLDERGVEYKRHYLNTSWYVGMKLYMATDDVDGTLTVDNLTPEQAIAATLGSGKLTAEQVEEAVYRNCKFYEGGEVDIESITDELNAALGDVECKVVNHHHYYDYGLHKFELSCGHSYTTPDDMPYPFCPICGQKLRGDEE